MAERRAAAIAGRWMRPLSDDHRTPVTAGEFWCLLQPSRPNVTPDPLPVFAQVVGMLCPGSAEWPMPKDRELKRARGSWPQLALSLRRAALSPAQRARGRNLVSPWRPFPAAAEHLRCVPAAPGKRHSPRAGPLGRAHDLDRIARRPGTGFLPSPAGPIPRGLTPRHGGFWPCPERWHAPEPVQTHAETRRTGRACAEFVRNSSTSPLRWERGRMLCRRLRLPLPCCAPSERRDLPRVQQAPRKYPARRGLRAPRRATGTAATRSA